MIKMKPEIKGNGGGFNIHNFIDLIKQKLGYATLAAFLLELSVISFSITKTKQEQQKENKERIALGLTNYGLT